MKWSREPTAGLRPFIKRLWVVDMTEADAGLRERVLPIGLMHLAWKISGPPLLVFSRPDAIDGSTSALSIVGGARSGTYTRLLTPGRSVGLQLNAGIATPLFGVPAHELAERHTSLDELWGEAATELSRRARFRRSHADARR